jgi:hypothetical protein
MHDDTLSEIAKAAETLLATLSTLPPSARADVPAAAELAAGESALAEWLDELQARGLWAPGIGPTDTTGGQAS